MAVAKTTPCEFKIEPISRERERERERERVETEKMSFVLPWWVIGVFLHGDN
jgi:hypothetical protein